jgi:hypothetical protein
MGSNSSRKELVQQAGPHSRIIEPPWSEAAQNKPLDSGIEVKEQGGVWSRVKATFSSGSEKQVLLLSICKQIHSILQSYRGKYSFKRNNICQCT